MRRLESSLWRRSRTEPLRSILQITTTPPLPSSPVLLLKPTASPPLPSPYPPFLTLAGFTAAPCRQTFDQRRPVASNQNPYQLEAHAYTTRNRCLIFHVRIPVRRFENTLRFRLFAPRSSISRFTRFRLSLSYTTRVIGS